MELDQPVSAIKGVGEEIAKKYRQLGIGSVEELIAYYPRRYDDYSSIEPIAGIKPGMVTIRAYVKQVKGRYVRRGLHITEAVASDDSGSVRLVWFNQPYRESGIKRNAEYFISGQFELSRQRLAIMNPSAELVSDFPLNTARIVPIYRETKGLKSQMVRRHLKQLVPTMRALPESLPAWIVKQNQLLSLSNAVVTMHFPASSAELADAKRRLGFEEVFQLSLASQLNKHELLLEQAVSIPFDERLAKQFVAHLPFKLTDAQRRAVWQIYLDMQKTQPMNRLLEGDVGSGKTVVGTMAAVMAINQGFQIAFMAPTEILARQHAETVHRLLQPLGLAGSVGLLIGGMPASQKRLAYEQIANGSVQFLIGTHALIQEKVDMHKLGLVIVDEQHRFGVEQRKKLQAKAGHMPHVLNMTATPIPRSLALTLYGELDVTIIETKPHGRKPIVTKICSPNSRQQLYETVERELVAGRQMFVVCPQISSSSSSGGRSAEAVYEQLRKGPFKHRRVGLLHGRMNPSEKSSVMEQFSQHELDILVATTVIEVGVDVPNASVMIIEEADKFGLAQMHQLRGRVGRGSHQGYCYLVTSDSSAPSKRLRALEQSTDGFKLAELDLDIRGPGAIYGTLQHGQLDLRVANLADTKLIAAARLSAKEFVKRGENLLKYPYLHDRVKQLRSVTNLN